MGFSAIVGDGPASVSEAKFMRVQIHCFEMSFMLRVQYAL